MDKIFDNKILEYKNSTAEALKKLESFNLDIDADIMYRIKNPIQSYIKENLPQRIKNESKRIRIEEMLKVLNQYTEKSFDSNIYKSFIENLLNKIKGNNINFASLNFREIKNIFKYDNFWILDEYKKYKLLLIQYLYNYEKVIKLYKYILLLYFRKITILKNDNDFKNLFLFVHKQYLKNCENIPLYFQAIFNDCNLTKDDIIPKLANACIERRKTQPGNILEIVTSKYRYIKPHTDIYDEIINYIGIICRENISDKFYFNLFFDELLCSEISNQQSAELVNNIIIVFAQNRNATQNDLESIKVALLKNKAYGDPRLTKSKSNWLLVEEVDKKKRTNAYQIFISWLAQADLEFFFNLIFENKEDPHGRKQFWQKYIKSRALVGSRVILGNTVANSYKVKKEEEKNGGQKYPRFISDDCSCFILIFDRICVAEFSNVGNAVYFYDKENIPIRMDKLSYYNVGELKNRNIRFSPSELQKYTSPESFKFYHYTTWKENIRKYMTKIGIYEGD